MNYTLKHFANEVRLLLLKAEGLGFTTDEIGLTVDSVLEADWNAPISEDMLPDFQPE